MRSFSSVLLIGGTSEIGIGVINVLAKRGTKSVHLLGRDGNELKKVESKLKAIHDNLNVSRLEFGDNVADQIESITLESKFDLVLIAIGSMLEQKLIEENPTLIEAVNKGNVEIPTVALLATLKSFEKIGQGSIAVFGSVAGDRGRSINYVYGAGKAFIEAICEGLWQRIQGSKIRLTLVKPGPTETKMSRYLHKSKVKLAPVNQVSEVIAEGILGGKSVVYAPSGWRYIMKIVELLPNFVFNRLHF